MYETNLELPYLDNLAIRVRSVVIEATLDDMDVRSKPPELFELILRYQITSAKDVLHFIRHKHALELFLYGNIFTIGGKCEHLYYVIYRHK